jgi:hypothetical protein
VKTDLYLTVLTMWVPLPPRSDTYTTQSLFQWTVLALRDLQCVTTGTRSTDKAALLPENEKAHDVPAWAALLLLRRLCDQQSTFCKYDAGTRQTLPLWNWLTYDLTTVSVINYNRQCKRITETKGVIKPICCDYGSFPYFIRMSWNLDQ